MFRRFQHITSVLFYVLRRVGAAMLPPSAQGLLDTDCPAPMAGVLRSTEQGWVRLICGAVGLPHALLNFPGSMTWLILLDLITAMSVDTTEHTHCSNCLKSDAAPRH